VLGKRDINLRRKRHSLDLFILGVRLMFC